MCPIIEFKQTLKYLYFSPLFSLNFQPITKIFKISFTNLGQGSVGLKDETTVILPDSGKGLFHGVILPNSGKRLFHGVFFPDKDRLNFIDLPHENGRITSTRIQDQTVRA